jgi:hypothetical protein
MNHMNPTFTIKNLEGDKWLMTLEHDFGNMEVLRFTVKIPKSDRSLTLLKRDLFERAAVLFEAISRI